MCQILVYALRLTNLSPKPSLPCPAQDTRVTLLTSWQRLSVKGTEGSPEEGALLPGLTVLFSAVPVASGAPRALITLWAASPSAQRTASQSQLSCCPWGQGHALSNIYITALAEGAKSRYVPFLGTLPQSQSQGLLPVRAVPVLLEPPLLLGG